MDTKILCPFRKRTITIAGGMTFNGNYPDAWKSEETFVECDPNCMAYSKPIYLGDGEVHNYCRLCR